MHTLLASMYTYWLERATGAHTLTSGVLRVFARRVARMQPSPPLGESIAKILASNQ